MRDVTQIQFFQQIKDRMPSQLSIADEIADLLEISNDSVYRRLRGETALTFVEIKKLCNHYKVPLDFLSGANTDAVTFAYKMIKDESPFDFENYLDGILKDLKNIQKFERKEIYYAAEDVPLFHHFQFPELSAFKIYFWLKSILNFQSFENKNFNLELLNESLINKSLEIYNTYVKIPSTEIWTDETLLSTLKQLEYSWESAYFDSKEDALLICDQISKMMAHIHKQAELGFKINSTDGIQSGNTESFKMYHSEVMIGNNSILVNTGDFQTTYLSHNTLNYLVTRSDHFCLETENWLKNLIKKSIPISGVSEKHRNKFFRKANDYITRLREKINAANI